MGGKFTLDNAVDGGEPEQDVVAPQIDVTSKASARPKNLLRLPKALARIKKMDF